MGLLEVIVVLNIGVVEEEDELFKGVEATLLSFIGNFKDAKKAIFVHYNLMEMLKLLCVFKDLKNPHKVTS